MREAIIKYWPEGAGSCANLGTIGFARADRRGPQTLTTCGRKRIMRIMRRQRENCQTASGPGLLFETMAEDKLVQPTILYEFPTDISPLSKQKPDDPSLTERFEIYVAGMEIANGFSELNDPAEQERRFLAQIATGGDEVPKQLDVDYIRALVPRYATDCRGRYWH